MSTPSKLTPKSHEEIRIELKRRFDAFNETEEERHRQRREAGNLAATEENKRWLRPEAATAYVPEVGENDSLGG